ncbi:hypothetical protein IQ235_09430 [Oscillatoriales cyanobacterium LEGE 11467]|uniref:Uncharacterized protein n=1 Tax=Zarconia navalis LEGE 11467 TaxID=1828826 RepID=A0A928W0E8_9CYAN|nr:hypothetical protein [Zarconia navalis]MBE9041000.1 hypothetical protein [Zarconia navalis LEGE 11467]
MTNNPRTIFAISNYRVYEDFTGIHFYEKEEEYHDFASTFYEVQVELPIDKIVEFIDENNLFDKLSDVGKSKYLQHKNGQ